MKPAFALLVTAALCSTCFAQDQPEGFDWLKQFEGTWDVVSREVGADEDAPGVQATMTSRVIGRQWVVNEHRGPIYAGVRFEAVQTLGYDSKTKKYKGTWVDSMLPHTWKYTGSIGKTGNQILLESEGPDMADMTKMRMYRDVYEFISEDEIAAKSQMKNDQGEWETFMNSKLTKRTTKKVTPFLMFTGKAEQAIELYQKVFEDVTIESMEKYGANEPGKEGSVKLATVIIEGQHVKMIDSPAIHDFDFTPSFSFFVECDSEEQLQARFKQLSEEGKVMMPVDNYGFSQKFAWTEDRFGISWQLNLK